MRKAILKKQIPQSIKKTLALAITGLGLAPLSYGSAISFDIGIGTVAGPGNHTFSSGGSWSGNGTVNQLVAGDFPSFPGAFASTPLVSNTTGGTLITTSNLTNNSPGDRYQQTISYSVNNGTVNHLVSGQTSGSTAGNFGIVGHSLEITSGGVSSITLTVSNDTYLSAIAPSFASTSFPWLGGVRMANGTDNYNLAMTYRDIISINSLSPLGFTPGVANPTNFTTTTLGGIAFDSITSDGSFIELSKANINGATGFMGLKSFIQDGAASGLPTYGGSFLTAAAVQDSTLTTLEETQATMLEFTVTANDGEFDIGTAFNFSFDGWITPNFQDNIPIGSGPIPEPSQGILVALSSLLFLSRRRRK